MDWLMRALEALLGLAIIGTCVWRAKVMSKDSTLASVRWSISLLAAAGLVLLLAATLLPSWQREALVLLAGAVVWVQTSTARLWRRSVPPSFSRPIPLDSDFFESIPGGRR